MRPRSLAIALATMLTLTLASSAQCIYAQIDFPGAASTFATGINESGVIVGHYFNVSNGGHGFFLIDGVYTSLDCAARTVTAANGVNNVGQIVGTCGAEGFVYDMYLQTFTPVHYPDASTTTPNAINDAGTIVGYYTDPVNGQDHGFELTGTSYIQVEPQNSASTQLEGITYGGNILLNAGPEGRATSIATYSQNGFKPVPIAGYPHPAAFGGNASGSAIVGALANLGGAFIYQNGTVQILRPGACRLAVETGIAQGVNDAGQVVGNFTGCDSGVHGFLWNP